MSFYCLHSLGYYIARLASIGYVASRLQTTTSIFALFWNLLDAYYMYASGVN